MIKYQQLISDLRMGKILPLYLLYGEEEFLIEEAVNLIIKKVVEPGARDFNFNTLYCRETPVSEIVNIAQTLPLMSEKRLVIAKEVGVFKAADVDELISYLRSPSPSTCLVMTSNQRKYEKKSVISAVEAAGAVTAFYPLSERELVVWIEGWAKTRGLSIQQDAVSYLLQIVGGDLQKINNELQKVEIYLKEKQAVTLDHIKLVVGDFREYTSFDLVDAIGRKDREKAFLTLSRMLQEGEQPIGLLGMVAWNFRRLMQAKGMEAAGAGYEEIKKKLKVIWLQSASFQQQMRRFSLEELREAFTVMLSTDRALKSSSLDSRLLMERMILKLCGP